MASNPALSCSSPAALSAHTPAPPRARIDSLTSLRFFAAASIVIYHCSGQLGISQSVRGWPLNQGVSFFFVLSGFILTYVYPSMKSAGGTGRFFLREGARIWPAHVTALVLTFFIANYFNLAAAWRDLYKPSLLASVAMVHAWIPLEKYNDFVNGPSWSISTEFGFYILFPLLIWRWEKLWWVKLLAALVLLLGVFTFCYYGHLPTRSSLTPRGRQRRVTLEALTYMSPLGRVFEFVVGMCAALAWKKCSQWLARPRAAGGDAPRPIMRGLIATAVEVTAVTMAIAGMYLSLHLRSIYKLVSARHWPGVPAQSWIIEGGLSCALFALLIVVMALQRGWISRLLSLRPLVLLGDLSYSVYLLQVFVFDMTWPRINALSRHPYQALAGFWLLLLLLSYVVWSAIERPSRRMLVSLWPSHLPTKANAPPRASLFSPDWRWALGSGVLLAAYLYAIFRFIPVG